MNIYHLGAPSGPGASSIYRASEALKHSGKEKKKISAGREPASGTVLVADELQRWIEAEIRSNRARKKNLRQVQEEKPAEQESKTDTEIITQADGSRTLMITTHIGETETLMSVKLSEPSPFQNEYVKAVKKEAEAGTEDAGTKDMEIEDLYQYPFFGYNSNIKK